MDIRTYSGFAMAAELLNITSAAQRLNSSQSALSRQIHGIGESLGMRLFEKSGRNVRPTAAEEIFSTGNISKVVPVIGFDDNELQVGPIARKARDLYWDWAKA